MSSLSIFGADWSNSEKLKVKNRKHEIRLLSSYFHVLFSIIGEALNKSYFLFLVPVGVLGNLLSFMVSIIYQFKQF